jgi:tetratricopeptide (TPR) repeat protein
MASVRHEEALKRYPDNPQALKTQLQLAQCWRHIARQFSQNIERSGGIDTPEVLSHNRVQWQRSLENAAANYQKVVDRCTALPSGRRLTPAEDGICRQAALAVAECRFDLGHFDEALRLYEDLARRYRGEVEGLIALRFMWQCHGLKFQYEQARRALDQIRQSLRDMPATAFDNSNEWRSRRWWEEWLREKSRPNTP